MSDFSELCPLFSTGVYNEITIGWVRFTGISATMNALAGTGTAAAYPGSLKFERTVVVTKVFGQVNAAAGTGITIVGKRCLATGTVAGTAFASCFFSATNANFYYPGRIKAFTQASNKTFLAADVLKISPRTSVTDPGSYSFIVRYKEK